MSGAEHAHCHPQRTSDKPAFHREGHTSAVVCIKDANGHVRINTPLYFNPEHADGPIWGASTERVGSFVAANILYEVLQGDESFGRIRSFLMTLAGRIQDADDRRRPQIAGSYLLELSRAFSEEFIITLPIGVGVIPVDQVRAWLHRSITLPDVESVNEIFDETDDCYSVSEAGDVPSLPFKRHGFVCARDETRPTYNIAQRIWLRKKLTMDWQGPKVACESLAANVIDRFMGAQPNKGPLKRRISGDVGDFYSPFADDFLHTMPDQGGQIPVSVMSRWFSRQI